jgi:hypothetical protein
MLCCTMILSAVVGVGRLRFYQGSPYGRLAVLMMAIAFIVQSCYFVVQCCSATSPNVSHMIVEPDRYWAILWEDSGIVQSEELDSA